DPSLMGCPLPDRDHDAVPDLVDHCPDQPDAPDSESTKNGCPGLLRIDRGRIELSQLILFDGDTDVVSKRSLPVMRALATALRATPGLKKLSVEGHTDGQGEPEQNLALSQRRAESVRRWLIENGVPDDRLEAKGFGDTRPIATNKTSKG